jgi:Holliday junction resolvase
MSTPKKRGTNFEYRVAYLFRDFGYEWERSGSSLRVDLKIYLKGKLKYLVSCKKTSKLKPIYVPKSEIAFLRSKGREMGAEPLICFGFKRSPIFVFPVTKAHKLPCSSKFYKLLPEHGVPLKEMLGRETQKTKKDGGQ